MNKLTLILTSSLALLSGGCSAQALENYDYVAYTKHQVDNMSFSEAQLAQMLAPIALYPDSLLTHILIASTYPLEVIEAHRWRQKNDNASSQNIAYRIKDKDWDNSVKALVPFEHVLNKMNEDLTWMRQLGDAFLAQEEQVLSVVQSLRVQAQAAGHLDQLDNVNVEQEDNNIVIVSASPKIIYVPYYDTREVYGYWHWSHYPPVHWTYRNRHYHHGTIAWHLGVNIASDFFFGAVHWHHRYIVVNHHRKHHYRKRHHIISSGYSNRWQHKPHHRKGVVYRSHSVKNRYADRRVTSHHLVSNKSRTHAIKKRVNKSLVRQEHAISRNDKPRYKREKQQIGLSRASNHHKAQRVEKQLRTSRKSKTTEPYKSLNKREITRHKPAKGERTGKLINREKLLHKQRTNNTHVASNKTPIKRRHVQINKATVNTSTISRKAPLSKQRVVSQHTRRQKRNHQPRHQSVNRSQSARHYSQRARVSKGDRKH